MLRNHTNADGMKHQPLVVRTNDWGPSYFKVLDPFSQSHLYVYWVSRARCWQWGGAEQPCEEWLGLLHAGHGRFQPAPPWTHHRAQLSPSAKAVAPLGKDV